MFKMKLTKEKKITPEQFFEEMAYLATTGDHEWAHARADDLMCKVLKQEGYGDGIEMFEKMVTWCA